MYVENPFPKKIRDKETMTAYLDSDKSVADISLKVEYYDVMMEYLRDILKQVNNRGFQIKNAIDFMKFTSGLG